jgi:nitric oxide reductase subunit B
VEKSGKRVGDNRGSLAALFGVYGCLALALMLFTLREFVPEDFWNEKMVRFSFWAINDGLVVMLMFGLIPNCFYQSVQSILKKYIFYFSI